VAVGSTVSRVLSTSLPFASYAVTVAFAATAPAVTWTVASAPFTTGAAAGPTSGTTGVA